MLCNLIKVVVAQLDQVLWSFRESSSRLGLRGCLVHPLGCLSWRGKIRVAENLSSNVHLGRRRVADQHRH